MTKLKALKNALLLTCAVFPGIASAQDALPTFEVVGVSPVPGGEIDREKVPSNVQTMGAGDLDHAKTPSLLDGMVQSLPGVSLSDQSGNAFQRNLDYRGFIASPVPGTPQGLAVYQNGTRINEAFGDVVNWDLIPEMAIDRMTLMPNNPLFGLNAIGGALVDRYEERVQLPWAEARNDGRLLRADVRGAQSRVPERQSSRPTLPPIPATTRAGATSLHPLSSVGCMSTSARGAIRPNSTSRSPAPTTSSALSSATPVEMLNQRWSSVYTWPQTTHLAACHSCRPTANGRRRTRSPFGQRLFPRYRASPCRRQRHRCPALRPSHDPTLDGQLCIGDGGRRSIRTSLSLNTLPPNSALGEIDRNWTEFEQLWRLAAGDLTGQLFGHDNHFVRGHQSSIAGRRSSRPIPNLARSIRISL